LTTVSDPTRCKYYDICHSRSEKDWDGDYYCFLHLPQLTKSPREFDNRLKYYLSKGHTDFRHFVFPSGHSLDLRNQNLTTPINFGDVVFDGEFHLEGATVSDGLVLSLSKLRTINLTDAKIAGPIEIRIAEMLDNIFLERAKISSLSVSAKACGGITLFDADAKGEVTIEISEALQQFDSRRSRLHAGVKVKAGSITNVYFASADVVGKAQFDVTSQISTLSLLSAKFNNEISIKAKTIENLDLNEVESAEMLTVRAHIVGINCRQPKVKGAVDFSECRINNGTLFDEAIFDPAAKLSFVRSVIDGDLSINGAPTPPRSVNLEGCIVKKETSIRSTLGQPFIEIIAMSAAPELRGPVHLENVDLKECRLVGNSIKSINLSNVIWAKRFRRFGWCFGRPVLFDELVTRHNRASIPCSNIKEACQILKEMYRTQGDHVMSGYFHYAEMEMKRREQWWSRFYYWPESLYWLLSGYGIGYKRAFFWLVTFPILFGAFYWSYGGISLERNFYRSLLHSLQVATLQRPERPYGLSWIGEWIQTGELITMPVLAALFVLALRMRLKR
jgi:hypothetical protein